MASEHKERAIQMRRQGKSYGEILAEIPVAKSTLSLWLRSVDLSKRQFQQNTEKRTAAALRGAHARREARLRAVSDFAQTGREDVGALSERELWLIGTALHWAEGSKQNAKAPSVGIVFGNSDPRMLVVFLRWLAYLGVSKDAIRYELYIHNDRKSDTDEFRLWWSQQLGIPMISADCVYFKNGNIRTKRTNVGDLYHGLLRIKVKSSTALNRKVGGWIEGIVHSMGSGVIGNTSAFEAEDSRIVP